MINIETKKVEGPEPAITAMRNPFDSWGLSDSTPSCEPWIDEDEDENGESVFREMPGADFVLGEEDRKLSRFLSRLGPSHCKHLRQIQVWADITAPLYWWKEFDTYRFGCEKISCSTMHTIHKYEFTPELFACDCCEKQITELCKILNELRSAFLTTKNRTFWRAMIQLLPESFLQKRSVMMSYEALRNMYINRKGHRLTEWHRFREWVESLPYSELITDSSAPEELFTEEDSNE